jgi:hypothetical protein
MPLFLQLTPPQPDIFITNIRVGEPITALTGLCISLVCFWAYLSLKHTRKLTQRTGRYLCWVLLAIGISNVVSAIFGHAFLYSYGMEWKVPGWWLSMLGVALLAQLSVYRSARRLPLVIVRGLTVTNILLGLILATAAAWQLNFKLVELYTAFCLLLVMLPLELRLWQEDRNGVSRWLMLSLAPALAAVSLHIAKFSISPWFNFFDMGHLLLCGTVYCLWAAAEQSLITP